MANAVVTQSVVEVVILQNPNAVVCQSVVEVIVLPSVTPPAPANPITSQASGAPAIRSAGGCSPKNRWDLDMDALERKYRRIKNVMPSSCSIPEEYRSLLPWEDDFGAIPPTSGVIRASAGITTPAPIDGDQIMVSYRVPTGYFGLLSGFYFQYSGSGFVQGSGDLVFRIKVNQHYLKDLSNVLFTLGSTRFPIPMTQGQILLSNQQIDMLVNVPNLSGNIQAGQSTCYAGMFGFLWPYG